jgi:hypothetical protein
MVNCEVPSAFKPSEPAQDNEESKKKEHDEVDLLVQAQFARVIALPLCVKLVKLPSSPLVDAASTALVVLMPSHMI